MSTSSLRSRSQAVPETNTGATTTTTTATTTMDVESTPETQGLLENQPTTTTTTTDPLQQQQQTAEEQEEDDEPPLESELFERARDEWLEQLQNCQGICCLIAHSLSLLAVVLVGWWIHLLGGLSWSPGHSKQVFNWHPLLMVLAFCFMTVAALAFRAPYLLERNYRRPTIKLIHLSAWSIATNFALVALIAVFKSHNDAKSGFIANLYSLHSWLGIGMVGLYVVQFVIGFFSFWYNAFQLSAITRAKIHSIHSFVGPFLYVGITATILLGIQEKEGFVKCAYAVSAKDLWPLSHLSKIPSPCLVSHALGIVILATALCTTFALHDFTTTSRRN